MWVVGERTASEAGRAGRPRLGRIRHHRAIYDAIREAAPDQARAAMLEHLEDVEAMLGVLTESADVTEL